VRQYLSSVQNIAALDKSARITYELRNVNFMRWCCSNIATNEREVDNCESEVITLDINCTSTTKYLKEQLN